MRKFYCNIFITGGVKHTDFEKTIMLVGATGSGKSTIIDGIVNYVMGVNFDDPFRFTLMQLEEEKEDEESKEYKLVLFFESLCLKSNDLVSYKCS